MNNLFIIRYTFVVGPEQVQPLLPGHFGHLAPAYERGLLVASGSSVPFTGGIVLARGAERAEVEAFVEADPFVTSGAATVEILEFEPGLWSKDPGVEAFFGGVSKEPGEALTAQP